MPSLEYMEGRVEDFIEREVPGLPIPPTPANIAKAQAFALRKWRERRSQQNKLYKQRKKLPTDLTDACKFCSMFAVKVFGGEMQGNNDHQWVIHDDAEDGIIDLTDYGNHPEDWYYYEHDDSFWMNPDHVDALESCIDRVNNWLTGFVEEL